MKRKLLLVAASSVCLLTSTAAIAVQDQTVQASEQMEKPAKKPVVEKQPAEQTKNKTIYEPADKDIKHPTMPNLGRVKHLGSFINMGPQDRIQINGFMSAGVSGTTATPRGLVRNTGVTPVTVAQYDRGYVIPERGLVGNSISFGANTLVGLQFTGNITSSLSAVAQFVSAGSRVDGYDAYDVQTQWAFVRYRPTDQWQLRAGRMRIPLFAYSDTQEIAYTYPWVFLPNTVYRIVPFNNFNGADVVFSQPLGKSDWLLRFHPFYGTNNSQFDVLTQGFVNNSNGAGTCTSALGGGILCAPAELTFKEKGIIGAEMSVGNDTIQVRGSYAHTSLDGYTTTDHGFLTQTLSGDNAYFYSLGLKLAFDWFHFQGEFASRHAQKAVATEGNIANLNGFYTMVGGQFGRWFPNITYGNLTTTNRGTLLANNVSPTINTNEAPQAEEDVTLGVSYTVNSNVVVKTSATRIKPEDNTWGLYNYSSGRSASWLFAGSVDVIF